MSENKINLKLETWQKRLSESDSYFDGERKKMDERERLYNGDRELEPLVPGDHHKDGKKKQTSHVRNIIFENIESQISSAIPQPKVTARRAKDEKLAELIEHFLRNELDRLPFEIMNDMAERTVLLQGGTGFLVEWDNAKRTHTTVGAVEVSTIHPKQLAPQPGIYTGIGDMDWFIIKIPTTKEEVRRKYGKSVHTETESEPEVRSTGSEHYTEDAVTMYVGFETGENGCINKYVWVNDVELEDLENYQARRQPVCEKCGRVRPLPGQVIYNDVRKPGNLMPDPATGSMGGLIRPEMLEQDMAGHQLAQKLAQQAAIPEEGPAIMTGIDIAAEPEPEKKYDGGPCPWCGCEKFTSQEQEYEQVILPIKTATGIQIPGAEPGFDELGNPVMKPTLIPFYKPDVYPFILQRFRLRTTAGQFRCGCDTGSAEHHQPAGAEDH